MRPHWLPEPFTTETNDHMRDGVAGGLAADAFGDRLEHH